MKMILITFVASLYVMSIVAIVNIPALISLHNLALALGGK